MHLHKLNLYQPISHIKLMPLYAIILLALYVIILIVTYGFTLCGMWYMLFAYDFIQ